jgi:hypothetical protein
MTCIGSPAKPTQCLKFVSWQSLTIATGKSQFMLSTLVALISGASKPLRRLLQILWKKQSARACTTEVELGPLIALLD